jgi:hypothetical protein
MLAGVVERDQRATGWVETDDVNMDVYHVTVLGPFTPLNHFMGRLRIAGLRENDRVMGDVCSAGINIARVVARRSRKTIVI